MNAVHKIERDRKGETEREEKGGVRQRVAGKERGKRGGNAGRHVSMGIQERFGVRESCIITGRPMKRLG